MLRNLCFCLLLISVQSSCAAKDTNVWWGAMTCGHPNFGKCQTYYSNALKTVESKYPDFLAKKHMFVRTGPEILVGQGLSETKSDLVRVQYKRVLHSTAAKTDEGEVADVAVVTVMMNRKGEVLRHYKHIYPKAARVIGDSVTIQLPSKRAIGITSNRGYKQ